MNSYKRIAFIRTYRHLGIWGASQEIPFLFDPKRLQSPAASLSGGERNRLLLAKLFAKPSNVLVLDEPTNDLDIETLEVLEQLIVQYPGTVLIVSHDRSFINNTVTSTMVLEEKYQQWAILSDAEA